jgi:hypothetical protein
MKRMKLPKRAVKEQTRRQRIAGDSNASASYSYYSRRSETASNTGRDTAREALRPAARKLGNFWVQRFGLLVLIIAASACLINSAQLSSHAKVITVQSAGGAKLLQNSSVYEAAADELLSTSLLNRSKITVNTTRISQELKRKFPEVAQATITLPLLAHRPIIYLTPVKPALLLATSNGSFVIDVNGRALLPSAGLTSETDTLPQVIDQSGLSVTANKQVLPSSNVAFIQEVVAQLNSRKFLIASLTLPAGTQELDVRFADKPFYVKFNLASPTARAQSGTFLAVFAKLQGQGTTPSQYVDVRVAGRAYYQ